LCKRSGGDKAKRLAELPEDKQFLVSRNGSSILCGGFCAKKFWAKKVLIFRS
jgi:hypothetical protein